MMSLVASREGGDIDVEVSRQAARREVVGKGISTSPREQ